MPYVNIPDSFLSGTIAKLIGKIEGDVSSKIVAKANDIQVKFRTQGCPTDIDRLARQVDGLNSASQSIGDRLGRFRSLPSKLKPPLAGLKAAIKIILSLPIPQSVPPGFGIPVNITTKYADILHLLKEFVKQIGDDVSALEFIVNSSSTQLSSVTNLLNRANVAVKSCQVEKALKDKIDSGDLTQQQLKDVGLINDDEVFIFSTLGPKLMNTESGRSVSDISAETGLSNEEVAQIISDQIRQNQAGDGVGSQVGTTGLIDTGKGGLGSSLGNATGGVGGSLNDSFLFSNDPTQALNDLLDSLLKLQGGGISLDLQQELRKLLDTFQDTKPQDRVQNSKFFHTGPDGTVYELKINLDPQSPPIAPRRFATATNQEGVEVFRGDKSFSSSTDILLKELKFRIDNQLS